MARSRKSVDELVGAALAAPEPSLEPSRDTSTGPWAVAWSGGMDSTVLLHAAVRVAGPGRVLALHVHHGLQAQADGWVDHCAARAASLGVRFRVLRARGAPARGDSVERWARGERYRLLLEACRESGAAALLTAHHADDQLETVLLALARGSGLDGLTGIAARDRREGVTLVRPLLALDRESLAADARAHGLEWVEDPSNADEAMRRNAVRSRVLPVLRSALPGIAGQVHEALDALREARVALAECAARDLASVRLGDGSLDRRAIAVLSPERRTGVLRAWVESLGAPPPTRARLEQMSAQLVDGRAARGEVRHAGHRLARHRDAVLAEPLRVAEVEPRWLRWSGEAELALGAGGTLRFTPCRAGLDPAWLAAQELRIGVPGSAERLRPVAGGPSRTLKNLRQEAGLPPWRRSAYPAVWAGARLLLAAPFGRDRSADWPGASPGIELGWEPAAALSAASTARPAGCR